MDALTDALLDGDIDCDYVMVTKDYHPSNHCSFKENGGQWPTHCVVGTAGCCVHETICDLIAMGYKDNIVVDTKYIASIDGGDKLANLIKNCGLKWD